MFDSCSMYDVDYINVVENNLRPNSSWRTMPCQYGWQYDFQQTQYPSIVSEVMNHSFQGNKICLKWPLVLLNHQMRINGDQSFIVCRKLKFQKKNFKVVDRVKMKEGSVQSSIEVRVANQNDCLETLSRKAKELINFPSDWIAMESKYLKMGSYNSAGIQKAIKTMSGYKNTILEW